ncbi:sulfatase [Niabella ginsengisoli]|uniref:Sulfatase n=1 Tax=Niabella ginsengisoli TaxID=522298 RepID=A0ABS9SKU9_9BACT|nr:sulfatase [Niabella ginsengisoli]MCH5598967.1 sulfatase [Niabella ginsengisoli]
MGTFFFISLVGNAQTEKLNIIYILADDLGYSELECYGNKFNETPFLNKLASEGMRFTRFYAAAPVCSPYRAALMTGQYPARLKITDYLRPNSAQHLPLSHTTLAEMLKANGYHTGIVGKWHLSGYVKEGASEETLPDQHGFDEVLVSENRGIAEGAYFWPYFWNREIQKKLPGEHEYLTDRQHYEALEFIERNKDQPFFLYLSHYAVHTAVHGKPELVEHFKNKKGAGTSEARPKNKADDPYKPGGTGVWAKENNPHLAAQLKVVDEGVGAILKKLTELGLDKNTLIIFTSDNGGETRVTNNAPLKAGKSCLYEGGVREPFIIWGPGIKKGAVCSQPLVNFDVYPTFEELIKAKKNNQPLDGFSFARLLKNPEKKMSDRKFYWHYPLDQPHFLGGRSAGSIIDGKWKLIEFFDDNTNELYNMENDLGEANNLSDKNPKIVTQLKKELATWRKNVGVEM